MTEPTATRWNIPQRLDEPARILFMTMNEVVLIISAFFVGIFINQLIFCLVLAGGVIFLTRKFVDYLNGLSVFVLSYWFLSLSDTSLPASWKRHWRG